MNTRLRCLVALSLVATLWTTGTRADDVDDLRNLRDTTTNLIELLVKQGVLTREKADDIILQAHQQAVDQGPADTAAPAVAPPSTPATSASATAATSVPAPEPTPAPASSVPAPAAVSVPAAAAPPAEVPPTVSAAPPSAAEGVVRVPYVPEMVKQQIRDEIKKEVLAQAKEERWGDPGALPEWLNRISWSGDLRLRGETDLFPTDGDPNQQPANYLLFGQGYSSLYNTTETRNRLRLRARFGLQTKIADSVTAGLRLATGAAAGGSNPGNPSSENVTLGNYDGRYGVGFDRAYISYQPWQWLSLTGGRFGNPFFAPTDLVWNDTFSPEGAVAKFSGDFNKRLGGILMAGAFPIQQQDNGVNFLGASPGSKWLFGYQTGLAWQISRMDDLKAAVAFYDYRHVEGTLEPSSQALTHEFDWTQASFRQKGNYVFDIHQPYDNQNSVDPANYLWGLASKFRELNASFSLDVGDFAPTHMILDADYVKNLGFHSQEIQNRTGLAPFEGRTVGYQTKLTIGIPKLANRGDWQAFAGYRSVERDAVMDAFTDTDFHLGGTDAKGYFVGGKYGLAKNTVVSLRWLSASAIDNLPLAIDVLQLDVSVSF